MELVLLAGIKFYFLEPCLSSTDKENSVNSDKPALFISISNNQLFSSIGNNHLIVLKATALKYFRKFLEP